MDLSVCLYYIQLFYKQTHNSNIINLTFKEFKDKFDTVQYHQIVANLNSYITMAF